MNGERYKLEVFLSSFFNPSESVNTMYNAKRLLAPDSRSY